MSPRYQRGAVTVWPVTNGGCSRSRTEDLLFFTQTLVPTELCSRGAGTASRTPCNHDTKVIPVHTGPTGMDPLARIELARPLWKSGMRPLHLNGMES